MDKPSISHSFLNDRHRFTINDPDNWAEHHVVVSEKGDIGSAVAALTASHWRGDGRKLTADFIRGYMCGVFDARKTK